MPIVYVTNHDPSINYSRLSQLGSVAHVTSGLTANPRAAVEQAASTLCHSHETDILCVAGDPKTSAIVLAMWLQLHKSVHLVFLDAYGLHTIRLDSADLLRYVERARDLSVRR